MSHLSLPDLLGPRSAVLRRTVGAMPTGEPRCSAACSPASLPQPTAATRHRFSALPPAQDAPSCASSTFLSPPSRYGFLSGSILAELNQPEPSLTRSFGSWQGERRTSAPDHLQAARRPRVPEAAAIRWVQSQLPPSASSMMAFTAAGLSALELWAGAFYPANGKPVRSDHSSLYLRTNPVRSSSPTISVSGAVGAAYSSLLTTSASMANPWAESRQYSPFS